MVAKKLFYPKEFYVEEYLNKGKSCPVIAKKLGVCYGTILNELKRFGIERRNPGYYNTCEMVDTKCNYCGNSLRISKNRYDSYKTHYCNVKCRNTKLGKLKRINISKSFLEEEYSNKERSCIEIAKDFNCNDEVIRQRLIQFGIERRDSSHMSEGGIKSFKEKHYLKHKEVIDRIRSQEMVKCKCGCGELRLKYDNITGKRRLYILGHARLNFLVEEKTKEILRKFYLGKTLEEIHGEEKAKEIRKKLGVKIKGKTWIQRFGEEKANKVRKKLSKSLKGKPPTGGSFTVKSRAKMILPKKDSQLEVKIRKFLKLLKIDFKKHLWMNRIKHKYCCDIFIPSMELVIECDGDFIHCNPDIYPPDYLRFPKKVGEKTAEQLWEDDRVRTNELINIGYSILRLWGHQIKAMELDKFKSIMEFIDTCNLKHT